MSSYKVKDNRSAEERQREEDNKQPWRCMGCGKPIRPGRNEPCYCPQFAEAKPKGSY